MGLYNVGILLTLMLVGYFAGIAHSSCDPTYEWYDEVMSMCQPCNVLCYRSEAFCRKVCPEYVRQYVDKLDPVEESTIKVTPSPVPATLPQIATTTTPTPSPSTSSSTTTTSSAQAKTSKNWKQQNLCMVETAQCEQNLCMVETAQCEGMVEVEAARYEQTLPTPSPSIRPVKTAGTQRVNMQKLIPIVAGAGAGVVLIVIIIIIAVIINARFKRKMNEVTNPHSGSDAKDSKSDTSTPSASSTEPFIPKV